MDGFARPARPAGAPPVQNQGVRPLAPQTMAEPVRPVAQPRPAGIPARPMGPAQSRAFEPESKPQSNNAPAKSGGGWKVVLQFVVGLLVIVGVAAAIVFLYIKYYQQ
jgi:hypothetical protein